MNQKINVEALALEPKQGGHTYAAYYPLGCLVSYAKVHADGELMKSFNFKKIKPISDFKTVELMRKSSTDNVVILLSCYVWNIEVNMDFAKQVKALHPHSLIIVGGPQIPQVPKAHQQFFDENQWVDVSVKNEGEMTLAVLLSAISKQQSTIKSVNEMDFSSVDGLTFRNNGTITTTQDRNRSKDLCCFPSPYATGEFDPWLKNSPAIMLESNRGCPYGCTFCDWGSATLSKLNKIPLERVFAEIDFAAKNHIHLVHFCDSNFGLLPRDVEIAEYVIKINKKHGYPKRMGFTNAKKASKHLKAVIKLLFDAGLTDLAPVSMQTIDVKVLDNVKRSNIKIEEYKKLIGFLHKEGIPTNSDMLLGLPGQTYETCKKDLQFFFDHKVLAVIFQTSIMPNAPMANDEYMKKYEIKVSDSGLVESTYSFSVEDYREILNLCIAYKMFVKIGLLKHLLYYVQIEYEVKSIDFIDEWLKETVDNQAKYPISYHVQHNLFGFDANNIGSEDWLIISWTDAQGTVLFDHFEAFQKEIIQIYQTNFNAELNTIEVNTILKASAALMRNKNTKLPNSVDLDFDINAYFKDVNRAASLDGIKESIVPLNQRNPFALKIPIQPPCLSYDFKDARPGASGWQLNSNFGF